MTITVSLRSLSAMRSSGRPSARRERGDLVGQLGEARAASSRRAARARRRAAARRRGSRANQRSALSTIHRRTSGAAVLVEVDRRPPGRVVGLGEVGAEARQVVPAGPEVVVDHVEADAQAALRGTRRRSAAGRRGRRRRRARHTGRPRRSPSSSVPAKAATGMSSTTSTPSVDEVVEPAGSRVEGALGRERADVQLVEHPAQRAQALLRTGPGAVPPLVRAASKVRLGAVDAMRLPRAARVGLEARRRPRGTRSRGGCAACSRGAPGPPPGPGLPSSARSGARAPGGADLDLHPPGVRGPHGDLGRLVLGLRLALVRCHPTSRATGSRVEQVGQHGTP